MKIKKFYKTIFETEKGIFLGLLLGWLIWLPVKGQQTSHKSNDSCRKYCNPGVKGMTPSKGLQIGVEAIPNASFEGPNGNIHALDNSRRFFAKLKFPIWLKPSIKLFGGINMSKTEFHFKNDKNEQANGLPGNLNDRDLKSSGITLYGIKAFNKKSYLGIRASVSFNGDYSSLFYSDRENMKTSFAAIYGLKPSKKLEYGIGMVQSYWNHDYSIIPVFQYNYTSADFGIEALVPKKVNLRYNLKENTRVLYTGVEYTGQEYLLDGKANHQLLYDNSALRFKTSFEQRVITWVWLNVKAGYQKSIDFTFERNKEQRSLSGGQQGSIFGGVELSIRPPKDF